MNQDSLHSGSTRPEPTPEGGFSTPAGTLAAGTESLRTREHTGSGGGLRADRRLGWLAPGVSGGVALLLGAWQISHLSFNQDEAATLSAIRRPLGSMLAVFAHIDAVHGAYYLVMHLMLKLGPSEAIMRAPSVLAMAGTAALITVIGTRCADTRTGLVAGLIFATCSLTTQYAQDARPFALATFLAVLASYLFLTFARTGTTRDAAWYGLVIAACGLVNIFTLLIAGAHAATLMASPVARTRLRSYALALSAAAVVVAPVAWLAATEVNQVGWEHRPGPAVSWGVLAALAIIAVLSFRLARKRPADQHDPADQHGSRADGQAAALGPAPLIRLSAPWLIGPAAVLLIVSQITIARSPGQPASAANGGIWEPRYLLFCLPAAALLLAAFAARLPAKAARAAAIALILAAAATQPFARPTVNHNDLRAVAALLAARSRPGDAVLFPDIAKRLITAAYPDGFVRVRDLGLDTSPAARDSLYGLNLNQQVIWHRLAHVDRVWIIIFPAGAPAGHYGPAGHPDAFCLRHAWTFPLNQVMLYGRCAS